MSDSRSPRKAERILICGLNYAPEVTGVAPYTTKLAEALANKGHEVSVLAGFPHYPQWKRDEHFEGWSTRRRVGGVDLVRLTHFIPSRPSYLPRVVSEISFGLHQVLARWRRPDVMLLVSPALFSSAIVLLMAKVFHPSVRTVLWVQDLYGRGIAETTQKASLTSRIGGRVARRVESWVARTSDSVVAIHEDFASYISDDLGVPAERVEVIRNWSHLSDDHGPDREHMRASLGWPEDTTIVLHAGNMGVKQGLDNVVHAARIAADARSKVHFVLLGSGSQMNELKNLAAGSPNLTFLPPLDDGDFQAGLRAADVLLINELPGVVGMSVPSKLTSYFTAGRPVLGAVHSDGTAAQEIRSAGAGVVVEPGKPELLLLKAEELSAEPGARAAMGRRGRDYMQRVLSSETAVLAFEDVLLPDQISRVPSERAMPVR